MRVFYRAIVQNSVQILQLNTKQMKKINKNKIWLLIGLTVLGMRVSNAQMTLSGQVRTRTEVRNGLGNLVLKDAKTAGFTSQRTRLIFGYKWDRVTFGASVQDVRVWGQDASSISAADGSRLMLHEGWSEVTLANKADTTIKFKLLISASPNPFLKSKPGRSVLSLEKYSVVKFAKPPFFPILNP